MAGVTAAVWIAQVRLQGNGLAFCNGEGATVGIAAAIELIGGSRDIGLCGTEQSYAQVIAVGSGDATDETTKWQ